MTGLRADVYSSTAAEVFWDRSDVVLARYRVYLNGQFQRETDGISWYLDDLAVDSQSTVGVTAIVSDGVETDVIETTFNTFEETSATPVQCRIEGLTATVTVSTPANTPGMESASIINRQNHVELVGEGFRTYVGDDYNDPPETISSFTITGRNPDGSFIDVYE